MIEFNSDGKFVVWQFALTESTITFDTCSEPLNFSLEAPLLTRIAFNYLKTKNQNELLTFCRVPLLTSRVFNSKFCFGSSLQSYKFKNALINIRCLTLSEKIKNDNGKRGFTFERESLKLLQ